MLISTHNSGPHSDVGMVDMQVVGISQQVGRHCENQNRKNKNRSVEPFYTCLHVKICEEHKGRNCERDQENEQSSQEWCLL